MRIRNSPTTRAVVAVSALVVCAALGADAAPSLGRRQAKSCDTIYQTFAAGTALTAQDYSDWATWACSTWFPSGIGSAAPNPPPAAPATSCDSIYALFTSLGATALTAQDRQDWLDWTCVNWFPSGIGAAPAPHPAGRTCDSIFAAAKTATPSAQDLADWASWTCTTWFPSGLPTITTPSPPAAPTRTCTSIHAAVAELGQVASAQDLLDWVDWKCDTWYPGGLGTATAPPSTPPTAPPPAPSPSPAATRTCDTIYASYQSGSKLSDQDLSDWSAWKCSTWFGALTSGQGAVTPVKPPASTPPSSPPASIPNYNGGKLQFSGSKQTVGRIQVPSNKVLLGAYLDMSTYGDTPQKYASRIGKTALMFGDFFPFPLDWAWYSSAQFWKDQLGQGATFVMTLEPMNGLYSVTDDAINALVSELWGLNGAGIGVIIRFAHEMNGGWYIWGRKPSLYKDTFQRIARAVHTVPNCAMLWAPNNGLNYPWSGGAYDPAQYSQDFNDLDTNKNGQLDQWDDPYSPYYPGDEYVDWVGMSVYWYPPWPNTCKWSAGGPAPNAIERILRGQQVVTGEYQVPDFITTYSTNKGKPFMFAETAMHYLWGGGNPPSELDMKRAWWSQLYGRDLLTKFNIKGIMYFEINKNIPIYNNQWTPYALTYDDGIRWNFLNEIPMDLFF
ncbi:glycoside hydrolase family 26 protein [Gonapodya prolifera JEL478]|uniref:Glycoside hydrolase family 26 protein n=1 Tax=Gonapodya prolifera (strain JEL478) TaxID=1344416 RepID=A0A139ABI3_GONPJ|nr:glycoside hydrolase family 26 protein [Gonapodya prolifera JEL478]|eukprot:KXS14004.1 glycoside hydrolase family 26 protein [Gonapodya prolifera JEL478]